MLVGIGFVVIGVLALYFVITTDLEKTVINDYLHIERRINRVTLYLGIFICMVVGVVSIVRNFL